MLLNKEWITKMILGTNKIKMDYHELSIFMSSAVESIFIDQTTNFDDKVAQIIHKVQPLLTEDFSMKSMRKQCLHILAYILREIKQENTKANTDAPFNVSQYQFVKNAVEFVILIGFKSFLLPGVGVDIDKLCPIASTITREKDLSCLEEYEQSCFSVNLLLELFDDLNLRPAVLLRIGPLMATLLQLSHAPLAKSSSKVQSTNLNDQESRMTTEEYLRCQVLMHRNEFHTKLISLLNDCPRNICFRELMAILGVQNAPRWLRRVTQNYLIKLLMQPSGVSSLIATIYNDGLDVGADWRKLDTISRLIASTHGTYVDEYYEAVCPQILDLFSSDKFKHGSIVANSCIKSLYDYNPRTCQKYIIEVICAHLTTTESHVVKSEKEIEWCIEILAKCFLTEDAKFKHLPCKVIFHIATPIFCLYDKVRESACTLKTNLRQLLLKIFEEETTREKLYSACLGHDTSAGFGDYVISEFGPSGGIKITGLNKHLDYEKLADTILDLVSTAKDLSPSLFCYMLKFLSNVNKWSEIEQPKTLETEDDKIERITMQLAAHKLLSQLASTSAIQDAQIKNPEPLLSFIKLLFDEYTKSHLDKEEESKCEILYISLMLIKMILIEKSAAIKIDLFKDFKAFLDDHLNNSNTPTQLKSLISEVVACITTHDSRIRSEKKYYQDLSSSSEKFDEALKDLTDPLLPVQAHGLVALTKLIETKDPYAVARNVIILRLFQENLKHEDSFIYLASINGLCALATAFPEKVIETLMLEYINMPKRFTVSEVPVETRIKLGEILVKTTRALGEMSVVQKNMLVNGFLCAIRDEDPLVRASSLSCLGELCEVLNYRLGNILTEIIYCIACILKSDKVPECRRAAVLVATLLFRGLDRDLLSSCTSDMIGLYRELRGLRDDKDPVLQLHVQLALEEIDRIMRDLLTEIPAFGKGMFDQLDSMSIR